MLVCPINVSEGRDRDVIGALAAAGGSCLLDVHSDADHHRTVLTLGGPKGRLEAAVRQVIAKGVELIDLGQHQGSHPRLGSVDVVPFVPVDGRDLAPALEARGDVAGWAAAGLGVPCFLYGPERSLPDVRRRAFRSLPPDTGPGHPHPRAGAMCVGARGWLVAYNVWLAPGTDLARARAVAALLRGPAVRALGLAVGEAVQVSFNLVDPLAVGPGMVADAVARHASVIRTELVGLIPAAVLEREPVGRWAELDLAASRTVETRLNESGRTAQSSVGRTG